MSQFIIDNFIKNPRTPVVIYGLIADRFADIRNKHTISLQEVIAMLVMKYKSWTGSDYIERAERLKKYERVSVHSGTYKPNQWSCCAYKATWSDLRICS